MGGRHRHLEEYTRAQVRTILEAELRLDPAHLDADLVHDLRVAVRRLRAVLRVFPSAVPEVPEGLDEGLREWASLLGRARDLDIIGELVAEASPTLGRRVGSRLGTERAEAVRAIDEALHAPAHAALLAAVSSLSGTDLLPRHLRRGVRRAESRAQRRLDAAGPDPDRLHQARKAARRARYAGESLGDRARAKEWKSIQDALGRHHDCVVAAAWIQDEPRSDAARRRLESWGHEALAAIGRA